MKTFFDKELQLNDKITKLEIEKNQLQKNKSN